MIEPNQQRRWDAVVIGAGPAGSLAAERLARRGRRVLLVDKGRHPRPKVCGGCLGAVGLAALDEAGLPLDVLGVASAELREARLHAAGRVARLPLGRRRAIDRSELDDALLAAAKRVGVTVVEGVRARIDSESGRRPRVRLGDGFALDAPIVLVAAGLGSAALVPGLGSVRRKGSRLGAGTLVEAPGCDLPPGRVVMACDRGGRGYVGLVRLPDGRIDAAAAFAPGAAANGSEGLGSLAERVLADSGAPAVPGLADAPWRATPTLTQRPRRLGAPGVLLLGDATGYVEPFTGEGIGWALRSALEIEDIADEAIAGSRRDLVRLWERRHHATIGRWRRRCRVVCDLIGARRVTPTVVRLLAAAPWAAGPVLRRIDPHAAPTQSPPDRTVSTP